MCKLLPFLLFFAIPSPAIDAPLRYRFEPGQWLIYERQVRVEPLGVELPPQRYTEQVQIWCLERRADEMLLLVDLMRVVGNDVEPARGLLLRIDPRGMRSFEPEALQRTLHLASALDLLPELEPALPDGQRYWVTSPDPLQRAWRFERSSEPSDIPGSLRVAMQSQDAGGIGTALRRGETAGSLWFDPARGRVSHMELTETDPAAGTRTLTRVRLYEERSRPPEWVAARLAEIGAFTRSLRSEDRLLDELTSEPARAQQTLGAFDRLWSDAQKSFADETSPFRRLAAARRQVLRERSSQWLERARRASDEVGRPAAVWALPNEHGETIRCEQVRDRLCVEMEWRGDDRQSVLMLPVLRSLRSSFAANDLSIVAINTGPDLAAEAAALTRPQNGLLFLNAQRRGDAPAELPVIRIVGPDQRLLRLFVGWRPTLAEDVRELIAGGGK